MSWISSYKFSHGAALSLFWQWMIYTQEKAHGLKALCNKKQPFNILTSYCACKWKTREPQIWENVLLSDLKIYRPVVKLLYASFRWPCMTLQNFYFLSEKQPKIEADLATWYVNKKTRFLLSPNLDQTLKTINILEQSWFTCSACKETASMKIVSFLGPKTKAGF